MAAAQKKYKVKKGDQVIVLAGRDKGKKGEIVKMLTEKDRVLVSGAQMVKRHQRPTPTNTGGIVEKEASIHVSNVALIDPKTDKPTRVGYKRLDNGEKVRIAKGSGEVIS